MVFFDFCEKGVPKQDQNKLVFAAFGFPKRFPKTSPSQLRFLIDFAPHFGAFFMTFDTLVGNCLDHGAGSPLPADSKTPSFRSGFADLPWVRRSRPAHTMTFGIHFSINFPDRLNLVICNMYNAKTSFLPFQASHLSIKNRSTNHVFSNPFLGSPFSHLFRLLFQNGRF